MSTEVSDWGTLLTCVIAFIAYLEAKKSNRTAEALSALRIVVEAAEKTETYCSLRDDNGVRDHLKESELAELWSQAAFLIHRLDKNLSVRLHDKSRFWRAPDTWDAQSIRSADISLNSVRVDANILLKKYA